MGVCSAKQKQATSPTTVDVQRYLPTNNSISLDSSMEQYSVGVSSFNPELNPQVKARLNTAGIFIQVQDLYSIDAIQRYQVLRNPNNWLYFGELNNMSQRHGIGRAAYDSGYHLEGIWQDDKATGYFRLIYPNGNMFEGQLLNGCAHGAGNFRTDTTYTEGNWVDNMLVGYGVQTHDDGLVYKGTFLKNVYHGYGVLEYKDGRRYDGQFQDGKKHGHASVAWPDGTTMQIDYRKGKVDGFGMCGSAIGNFCQLENENPNEMTLQCTRRNGAILILTLPSV